MTRPFRTACILLACALALTAQTRELPIGVFDSGTGGLTVLQAIVTLDAFHNATGAPGADGTPDFAGESFQYMADQANMPYGNYAAVNKTDLLKENILRCMEFLTSPSTERSKPPVKMLVIGCNTATAYALEDISAFAAKKKRGMPVVGVINAGVKAAMEFQRKNPGTIGVFATAGTVTSNGYPNAIRAAAKAQGMPEPSIVSQGGVGLAESIDRDWSYISDTLTAVRKEYKGPSLRNDRLPIDPALLGIYNFSTEKNRIVCEFDPNGNCLELQLNDPANYVRYHLVTLLETMRRERFTRPLNTLLLACTHYPYMRDTIAAVLTEMYGVREGDGYRYRGVLAPHVELIDPAVETAKEAYLEMRARTLQRSGTAPAPDRFFISVPNTALKEVRLQPDGWFTYEYKYGRKHGEKKTYVRYVPFDTVNVSADTYERFSRAIPEVYARLVPAVKGLR
ncbi:MAG: Asp/Glu/hydantoin racemase [Bacteroidetes bacterium]|nr:MAG: Asp/Glu/hydantoin racemase [Bacteroidota bacterium]